jgi:hypothetical protein
VEDVTVSGMQIIIILASIFFIKLLLFDDEVNSWEERKYFK